MKISSWNVNSVRARIINILEYIKGSGPDILLIQEIKTEEKSFPFIDFKNLGYESYVFGQKSYNGVAFLSKVKSYLNPEQPPPFTAILKNVPDGFFDIS